MNIDTSSKKLTLEYHAHWKLDVKTGEVLVPQAKRRYEAEHASIGGGAVIADCGHCLNVTLRGLYQCRPSLQRALAELFNQSRKPRKKTFATA
jgi:hypothetical protein